MLRSFTHHIDMSAAALYIHDEYFIRYEHDEREYMGDPTPGLGKIRAAPAPKPPKPSLERLIAIARAADIAAAEAATIAHQMTLDRAVSKTVKTDAIRWAQELADAAAAAWKQVEYAQLSTKPAKGGKSAKHNTRAAAHNAKMAAKATEATKATEAAPALPAGRPARPAAAGGAGAGAGS